MDIRLLDLDGAVVPQSELRRRYRPALASLAEWGPKIRLACGFSRFAAFENALQERWRDEGEGPALTVFGSGDFHHVSLALLRRLREPFNLLVLDKHPDWMRGVPFLHCGTWLYHAAQLPQAGTIFHVGGDVDFDNFYRVLAPWKMLREGKIVVFPAVRHYRAGGWTQIANTPVRRFPQAPLRPTALDDLLLPYRDELAQRPLYISLDKDVMVPADAAVNWDSGHLMLGEVQAVVERFIAAARGRLAGMDILGDWSPVQVDSLFRRVFHWTMHPGLEMQAPTANRINERTNLALIETVLQALSGMKKQAM